MTSESMFMYTLTIYRYIMHLTVPDLVWFLSIFAFMPSKPRSLVYHISQSYHHDCHIFGKHCTVSKVFLQNLQCWISKRLFMLLLCLQLTIIVLHLCLVPLYAFQINVKHLVHSKSWLNGFNLMSTITGDYCIGEK